MSDRQYGWLVESYSKSATGETMWLRLFGYIDKEINPEWTTDPDLALRLGRELDAEWIARLYPKMCCLAKLTEHIWIDGKRLEEESHA